MATRKAVLKPLKMTERQLLAMIRLANNQGFDVPAQTIIDATSAKTLARLFDAGVLTLISTAYGAMYRLSPHPQDETSL